MCIRDRDRPTGKLHLGHYTGSLRNRGALQNTGEYDMYICLLYTARCV